MKIARLDNPHFLRFASSLKMSWLQCGLSTVGQLHISKLICLQLVMRRIIFHCIMKFPTQYVFIFHVIFKFFFVFLSTLNRLFILQKSQKRPNNVWFWMNWCFNMIVNYSKINGYIFGACLTLAHCGAMDKCRCPSKKLSENPYPLL